MILDVLALKNTVSHSPLMILDDTGQSGERPSIFAFGNDIVLVGLNM